MPFSKEEKRKRYALKIARELGLDVNKDMSEILLKNMIKAHRDNLKLPKNDVDEVYRAETDFLKDDPTVSLFYETKKNWEKGGDQRWEDHLKRDVKDLSLSEQSEKMDRIREGISPLLFDIEGPAVKTYTIHGDEIKGKNRNEKEKWQF